MTELSRDNFQVLCNHIYKLCGLVIPTEKSYLINQRLEPILGKLGCRDLTELSLQVQRGVPRHINEFIIAAITTNETFFFRDTHPFEAFATHVLPQLIALVRERKSRPIPRSGPKVRIWSAASSTGQEAYSIAMLICEQIGTFGGAGVEPSDIEIMATDISADVMARAINGEYTEFEIARGLSQNRRDRFFKKEPNGNWRIDRNVQRLVTFRCCNLMEPISWLGSFDCIFCRNILIYFDTAAKARICQQFHQMLTEKGALFLGSSENMFFLDKRESLFKTEHRGESVYYSKIG